MNINVFYGKLKANLLLLHFKASLLQLEQINDDNYSVLKEGLNYWLYNTVINKYQQFSETTQLESLNKRINEYALSIIKLKDEDNEKINIEYNKLENTVQEFNDTLDKLNKKITGELK